MTLDRRAMRVLVAIAALMLVAGTALAAEPTSSPSPATPSASAEATADGNAPTKPAETSKSPETSESPEAPESPEAAESPEAPDAPDAATGPKTATQASPSSAELTRLVDLLKAAGITTTTSELSTLAGQVGVGGAVRVVAFAHASGKTPAQIVAMFQGGAGWGQIARQLGLSIGPGIGWIMSNGHGKSGSHGKP